MRDRAFSSERCPDCHCWLVGVQEGAHWFCTVCGCQITDVFLCEEMTRKASHVQKEPPAWADLPAGEPSTADIDKWKDNEYRRQWFEQMAEWWPDLGLKYQSFEEFKGKWKERMSGK